MVRHLPIVFTAVLLARLTVAAAAPAWTPEEKVIAEQLRTLRGVPGSQRGEETRHLALQIRRLPAAANKVHLASGLANLATEGDFGTKTLREVATTLSAALAEQPQPDVKGAPAGPYGTLAQLAHYEQIPVTLDAPAYKAAMARLEALDLRRASAEIRLPDLHGKEWELSALRGKVVVVNFWATWCPPCRKEFPDLEAIYERFANKGLVVLAISDEEADKVSHFLATQKVTFPVLLDSGRKVTESFGIVGIPKSFVYDREGKLAATAIDMRTRHQFLAMLAKAGLK
jgi:peroxiredoxin